MTTIDFRLVFTLLVLLIGYLYFKNRKSRHLLSKIPGPKGWPLLGNIDLFLGSKLPATQHAFNVFDDLCKQYYNEGIFKLTFGHKPIVILFKPETIEKLLSSNVNINKGKAFKLCDSLIYQGIATSTGDVWKRQRKLMTPAF